MKWDRGIMVGVWVLGAAATGWAGPLWLLVFLLCSAIAAGVWLLLREGSG